MELRMKIKAPIRNSLPMKKRGTLSPAMATRIRKKANSVLGVRPDKDSAAGAAT